LQTQIEKILNFFLICKNNRVSTLSVSENKPLRYRALKFLQIKFEKIIENISAQSSRNITKTPVIRHLSSNIKKNSFQQKNHSRTVEREKSGVFL